MRWLALQIKPKMCHGLGKSGLGVAQPIHRLLWAPPLALVAMAALLALAGCGGMVDDYAKTAIAAGEATTSRTIENLSRKHDIEAGAYAAAYCGQPRVGAVERRYADPETRELRRRMCAAEREIGFAP
ncbi:MAG: hypothetical protein ACREF4_02465 [Gammaproteobacteria bacterium]